MERERKIQKTDQSNAKGYTQQMKQDIDINYMPSNTNWIFETLSAQNFISNYILVGGTALAIQVNHRLSEDLDFIYDGDTININSIKKILENYSLNMKLYDRMVICNWIW
jgi:predicted nucleotidyltransferase component of viral defense system